MADQPQTADDVKAFVEDRDIRFVRLWFTDILGQLKSFSINAEELDDAFEGGMGFDGSSITGFNAIEESDMIAMPDPSTFSGAALAPRGPGRGAHVLRRRHARAASPTRATRATCCAARSSAPSRWASRTSTSGPELEFFYFRNAKVENGAAPEILDEGGYFDLTTLDAGSDVRRETVLALEELGIHVEYTHHEVGPSQHEIDMRYADALKMADDCMTYRITVKEYAMKYGWHATFMPKPLFGENGSGMHTHQSLFTRRAQRLLRRRRPVLPVRRRQGLHRRPAQARARDHLGVRPVGQLLQAARARLRGAGLLRLVAPQPLGARARAALPPRQGAGHAHGAALPGPRLQPLPDLRDPAGGRARGHREGLRAARADGEEPVPHQPGGAAAGSASSSCPRRSARRSS